MSEAAMARRKQSPLEDMIDVASLLPWCVGLILACIGYLILPCYAGQEIARSSSLEHVAEAFGSSMREQFAYFGEYLWLFIFGLGSVLSFIKKINRQNLYKQPRQRSKQAPLLDMSWQ